MLKVKQIEAKLFRYKSTSTHSAGVFVIGTDVFYTIERAWKNNKANVSCIPKGTYFCSFLPRSGSGKYKNVYHLTPTDPRSGILVHNGNLASHSKGCIIIGSKAGRLGGKPAVLGSKSALRKLNKIAPKGFLLEVL